METAAASDVEHQLYCAEQHWIVLLTPLLWALFSLIVFIKLEKMWMFGLILAAFAIGTGLINAITYLSAKFIITDHFVYLRSGLLRPRQVRLPLIEIHSAHVERSLLGRFMDYGMVIITDTKQEVSKLSKVDKPKHFVDVLERIVTDSEPDFGD